MEHISRNAAFELLKKYNKDPFHIQHALTVEAVMKWYANELGYGDDAQYWGIVGLLHDIDFELYPDQHCIKAPELLREGGVSEDIIHGVVSHGYGITVDVAPEHEMEKVLFAADELTGLIWAAALMRPSKSTKDMELKSLKKKYKSKGFAAGCSREVIERGAQLLGWELEKLLTMTLAAMAAYVCVCICIHYRVHIETNPLSANVVLIEGENNLWLYDVGNNPCVSQIISAFNTSNKKINVILSHFHADHIGNLDKISYSNVYQGRLTYKYTKTGEILENDLYFRDGNMNLHIFPLPSSHAKGSLALEINEKYCFLGDGVYAMQKGEKRLYNAGILKEEIEILKNIKAQHFMLSHRNPFDNSKDSVIRLLDGIYAKRKSGEPYISGIDGE